MESNDQKEIKKKKNFLKKLASFLGFSNEEKTIKVNEITTDKTMWVPDEKAPTCYNCQKQFSAIFLRKHHCRICGNVFCKECSSKNVEGKYWGK
jgi:hypothetical protein